MKKAIFTFIAVILALPNIGLATNPPADCSDNLITPVVSATENSDDITLSWEEITHEDLNGYKVVISQNDSTPVYPANGYLRWITNTSIVSQEIDNSSSYRNGDFGSYLDEGEDYYFSITAVYGCGEKVAGNVLHLTYPGSSDTDDDEDDDDTSNVATPTPVVSISSSSDGVLVSWEKIDDARFNGYKVVASKSDSKPAYPGDGYLKYITNEDTTSHLINNSSAYRSGDFGSYFKVDEDYYFSITALYTTGKVAGNAILETYEGPEHNTPVKPDIIVDPIVDMEKKAQLLLGNSLGDILDELKELRSIVKEQQNEIKYLRSLVADVASVAQSVKDTINQFITYGVDTNTKNLGEGERAAVIHSYKSAFGKLPESEDEMTDAIKIANGRWPSKTNEAAEHRAKVEFKKIYLRDANMEQPNDNAAVTVMAYGLRQRAENRNLNSETEGIKTFKYIYNKLPETTEDWNIMQSITYSGATR
ncbi:hypothetical protein HOB10_05055 [Candidatus Parcubacteria bacterium]|jgi:hypothetical protein|nr:hypothetical protein [Candidatus Parcubacteria bacterium]